MTEPGDKRTAPARGRGRLRASHADREQATEQLKVAFVQGRLDKDEFDARVGQALTARTYTELAAVTADLPAAPTAAQPPELAGSRGERPVLRPGRVIMVATAIYAGMWSLAFFLPTNSEGDSPAGIKLIGVTTFFYFLVLVMAGGQLLDVRSEKRSGGQPPPRQGPGPGSRAYRRRPLADPDGQSSPLDLGQQHTAEAARNDRPYPRSRGSWSAPQWRHRRHRYTIGYAGH
jgi:hypothetical protein